jgi:hypothetical protein
MKNILLFLMAFLMMEGAFAQHRRRHPEPRRPHPRTRIPIPGPRYTCQVVMVDRYHRVVNRYWGRSHSRFDRCEDAFRSCYWDLKRYGSRGRRCLEAY